MKRFFQHILAFLSVLTAWMTIYMLMWTEPGMPLQHNHESFFMSPEMEVTDMGGRTPSISAETLFPSAPLTELGPDGPPFKGLDK
ncbi:MAG: hypothetical protein MRZ79_17150 [Bacteroidia bacterium]|nr:hypothetical protein [Bacteroidia bacterium]